MGVCRQTDRQTDKQTDIHTDRKIVNTAACLCVVEGKDAETVRKWKEFEKSLGVSGTDSAFGSDLE